MIRSPFPWHCISFRMSPLFYYPIDTGHICRGRITASGGIGLSQVTLLESREKCEIKLTKPLKFLTGLCFINHRPRPISIGLYLLSPGRKDCLSEDPEGRKYVTTKPEVKAIFQLEQFWSGNIQVQNIMFGDAKHVIDFGRTSFGMTALYWTAIQAEYQTSYYYTYPCSVLVNSLT